jgi:tetratricopeptide (TPR) repeat protein
MKKYSALTLIVTLAVGLSQIAYAQGGKEAKQSKGNIEANRLAREGAEALKGNDFDKAVDLLRKAANLDHKYTSDLAIAYERRGYALAKNQQFQDAVQDYTEAIKIKSNEPRIYEERAYAEMKIYAYDKALDDYAELIKLKPKEVRYYNFRAYIYEAKEDPKNAMAETESALKIDPNNQEAKERKQRLERKEAEKMPTPPPNTPAPKKSPTPKKKTLSSSGVTVPHSNAASRGAAASALV